MDKSLTVMDRRCKQVKMVPVVFVLISSLFVCASAQIRHVVYNISENIALGTRVGNLVMDTGLHSEFTRTELAHLSFQTLSTQRVNISLVPNDLGILVVSGVIDREHLCPGHADICEINIDIYVSLEGMTHFSILKVTFFIKDVNDNGPRFAQRVFLKTLLESTSLGTRVGLPYAEDEDSSVYGVKEYQLVPTSQYFSVQTKRNADGSEDVMLRLDRALDFEQQRSINLTLVAYDGGFPALSGTMEIVISVSDANDHIPRFANSSYQVRIVENIDIGTTILRVQALDEDTGINSVIHYSFSQRTHDLYGRYFAMDEVSGDIIVRDTIDYESHQEFHLSVIGQDMGPNSHSDDANVYILVTDLNDCNPQIDINTLNDKSSEMGISKILEESPVGSFVAHVSVSDADSGDYGSVSCSLVSTYFNLENLYNNEYQIITKEVFDRELGDVYEFRLTCSDGGTSPNIITQRIQVQIQDINDNPPVFTKHVYLSNLEENNYEMRGILQVNATDLDIGNNSRIRYSLHHNVHDVFSIHAESGLIRALRSLDREAQERYSFNVYATDSGNPVLSASAEVVINVLDLNDEQPIFDQPSYVFYIPETAPAGASVGTVYAFDRDGDPYSSVSYALLNIQTFQICCSIDAVSGLVEAIKPLDREEQGTYQFYVQASDSGSPTLTSRVNVTVHIQDANDNAPVFLFPTQNNHTVHIGTNIPTGYALTRLLVRDSDIGNNGRIAFQLLAGDETKFRILNESGVITTKAELKLNDKETYSLRIRALDHGAPTLDNVAVLNFYVNKSLAMGIASRSSEGTFIIGTNLNLVIIISAALAVVIVVLIISIVCVYCCKGTRDTKQQCEYDQFHVRDETMETLQDNDGGHFDSVTRPQIRAVEYSGPTLHAYTADNTCSMDDSGLQMDDFLYHQRPVTAKIASTPRDENYNGGIERLNHSKQPHAGLQAKKTEPRQKAELDQDSTYSGDGSNPDSGKGPSEEGDNSSCVQQNHSYNMSPVLPPVLEEENNRHFQPQCTSVDSSKPYCTRTLQPQSSAVASNYHQPYITGITMCKCKSCYIHNRQSSHYATVTRHKDNWGNGSQNGPCNGKPRSSQNIEKVPRIQPRVPVRSEKTKCVGSVGVSAFGSCRDLENSGSKTVTFSPDASVAVYNGNEPQCTNAVLCRSSYKPQHVQVLDSNSKPRNFSPILKVQPTFKHSNSIDNSSLSTVTTDRQMSNHVSTHAHKRNSNTEEVDLNSSSTSGSYMVEQADLSDVLNDSHWNLRDSVV